jgi:hypothetical protein
MLGRIEVTIAITEMLRRYRTIQLATDRLTWHTRFNFVLGLDALPLRVSFR